MSRLRIAVDGRVLSRRGDFRVAALFTEEQIRETARQAPEAEFFLLLEGAPPGEDTLCGWDSFPNIHKVPLPGECKLDSDNLPDFGGILVYSHYLQKVLRRLDADAYHNTAPFLHPYYSAITVCPVVSTFYDTIPLIYPSSYLTEPVRRIHYLRCLQNVAASERVIAISRASANDLRLYTGFPGGRSHVAYPALRSAFQPLAGTEAAIAGLLERFVLTVTGIHRCKNVSLLLRAFHKVSGDPKGLAGWGLVLVLPDRDARAGFEREFGSPPGVVTLAAVSDAELNWLYRHARLVVQPSEYEGFAFPVAEAMSCGAAVIAAGCSCIPEVAGDAALLVPPGDSVQLAAAMLRVARDPSLSSALQARARARAGCFHDAHSLGAVTLDAYRRAAAAKGASSRPQIALWSSMPPLDCGVADYASELAGALAATHDVSVYVDGQYQATPAGSPHIVFRHPEDYGMEGEPCRNFFQVGARSYLEFMYPYIREHRGTMVLHDVSMAMGLCSQAIEAGRLEEFQETVVRPEGPEAFEAFARLCAGGMTPPPYDALGDLFTRHKMLQWIIDQSVEVLVHTDPVRQQLLSAYPAARARVVRMGVTDRIPITRHMPCAAWRHALGIGRDGLCIGCFGIVDPVKRLDVVIRSFGELSKTHPSSLLIIAGRCYEPAHQRDLDVWIAASGAAPRIVMLDYVPPAAYHGLMALSDVVVNLRSPNLLGLSATLIRAFAAAKPVIISDIPEWAIFPRGSCLTVAAGGHEAATLTAHLTALAGDPALRREYGRTARRWFLENATLAVMAGDYLAGNAG